MGFKLIGCWILSIFVNELELAKEPIELDLDLYLAHLHSLISIGKPG